MFHSAIVGMHIIIDGQNDTIKPDYSNSNFHNCSILSLFTGRNTLFFNEVLKSQHLDSV